MEIITLSGVPTSINLFPPLYENDETVFYHGTSELYSTDIENYGLKTEYKPLASLFDSLLGIGREIYKLTKGKDEYKEFNTAFTDSCSYFTNANKRLSFSPSSYLAAEYSIGKPGGQGLKNLYKLAEELNRLNFETLDGELNLISQIQECCFKIDNESQKFKNSDGVVYACKFEPNDQQYLLYHDHGNFGVLLSNYWVHPSQIVAKLIIGSDPNFFSDELLVESRSKTLKLCNENTTTPFLRDIITANL